MNLKVMEKSIFWALSACILCLALSCSKRPYKRPDTSPPAGTEKAKPEPLSTLPKEKPQPAKPQDPYIVKPVIQLKTPTLSETEKQEIMTKARLNAMKIILVNQETIETDAGSQAVDSCRDFFKSRLAATNYKVLPTSEIYKPGDENDLEGFFKRTGIPAVIFLDCKASQYDKFGNFYSYAAELNARAVKTVNGETIASKVLDVRGKRALSQLEAGNSAIEKAAEGAYDYISTELIRRSVSMVDVNLYIHKIKKAVDAYYIREQLEAKPGINYVSIERFEEEDSRVTMQINCRSDVRQFIGRYILDLKIGLSGNLVIKEEKENSIEAMFD